MLKRATPLLAATLSLAACGLAPVIEGEFQVAPEQVSDPAVVAEETTRLAGAYERTGSGAAIGQMTYLTIKPDGGFGRGRCATAACDTIEHQTGAYTLSQSKATGSWNITFLPRGAPTERYHYQRETAKLSLELVGDPRTFSMARLDDADQPADPVLTEHEVAKLAGEYRFAEAAPTPDTLLRLALTSDGRFSVDRCVDLPCAPGPPQQGDYAISKSVASGQFYIVLQPDDPAAPPDRFAYEFTGVGVRLRRAETARWFIMNW
jgi:hypothetical protein